MKKTIDNKENSTEVKLSKSVRCGKIGDFEPIVYRVESAPADYIKQKIARNHCLQTCKSWFDFENKILYIEHMKNAHDTELKSYSFSDVAAEFGWKSFKFSDDYQTVFPKFISK